VRLVGKEGTVECHRMRQIGRILEDTHAHTIALQKLELNSV